MHLTETILFNLFPLGMVSQRAGQVPEVHLSLRLTPHTAASVYISPKPDGHMTSPHWAFDLSSIKRRQ